MVVVRSGRGRLRRGEARAGLLFVGPWLVFLMLFIAYPVIATFYFSFTDYNLIRAPHWVGWQNYNDIFTNDTDFWNAVSNTVFYAFISVPLGLVVSLALALVLNLRAQGVGIYRSLFYLPALAPPVVSTLVFIILLDPDNGLVNTFLGTIGLPKPGWFADPTWSKPGLILLSLWNAGTATLIFLAGLQDIPQSLLEAATIDGAGPWSRFWHVTRPLLSPVVLFNLVMGVIYSFQIFVQALIVGTNTGDPVGSTLMYMTIIYNHAFQYFQMGYASALSVLLFLAVGVLTVVIFGTSRWWVYYEGGRRGA
jgi:multiple sugar transport system permease protein